MNEQTKHVYGAYLNMARNNAFITLSYISKLLSSEAEGAEPRLSEMKAITILNSQSRVEEKTKAINLLEKHLPFLKPMLDNKLSFNKNNTVIHEQEPIHNVYFKILTKVFNLLNLFRDQYSHYLFVDDRIEDENFLNLNKDIVYGLKTCFDGGRRIVKDRFSYTEQEMNFITKSRYEKIGEKFIELNNFYYKLDTSEKLLSEKGLCFLICLFLEKKYATLFLENSDLRFFLPTADVNQKKIIREIFSVYRIRLPKSRIESTKPNLALGLEMINELKKCPDELFQTLSKQDRDKFRIAPNNEKNELIESSEVLLKRYENRFPYFAMRFIDDNKIFNNIRFQVSLGKYRYKFYDKKCIDGEKRVRGLELNINGFGRLIEIEEKRKESWETLLRPFENYKIDTAAEQPYVTDKRASYVINGNRIGLGFVQSLRSSYFIPQLNLNETIQKKPDCWLSVHELPAMIFHYLICDEEHKKDTEKIIFNYRDLYLKFFSDIQNGILTPDHYKGEDLSIKIKNQYNLEKSIIPVKLWDYLSGKIIIANERFEKSAYERIEKMLLQTKSQLSRFLKDKELVGTNENKIGKESYKEIKPGNLAKFLSKDIIKFQPSTKKGKDKLTGLNFNVLQSSLAIYDLTHDGFKRLFNSAKLLGGDIKHPFLQNVLCKQPKDTLSFYEIYLKEKIEYLSKFEEKQKKGQSLKSYHFLQPARLKWEERDDSYYYSLANRYYKQSIELPRGLFEDPIKKILENKFNGVIEEKIKGEGNCNVSFLILSYFKEIYNDGNQEFYNYARTYEFFNKLDSSNREIGKRLVEAYYTVKQYEEILDSRDIIGEVDEYSKINSNKKKYDSFSQKKEIAINVITKKDLIEKPNLTQLHVDILLNNISEREINEKDIDKIIDYWESKRLSKFMLSLFSNYKKNEKTIRQYKIQDIILFLMAKEILVSSGLAGISIHEIEKYKLSAINPSRGDNILSLQIPLDITIKLKDGTSKTIHKECLKLKNYGDFFKIILDQRIKTLIPQIESDTINKDNLDKELEEYDYERLLIFKRINNFEKIIIEGQLDSINKRLGFNDILKLVNMQEIEKEYMRVIRNAFSHNEYPKKNVLISDNEIPGVAKTLSIDFAELTKVK